MYSTALAAKDRQNDKFLDFVTEHNVFYEKWGRKLPREQLDNANETLKKFKNAVMFFLV